MRTARSILPAMPLSMCQCRTVHVSGLRWSPEAEHLPGMHQTLGSTPSTTINKFAHTCGIMCLIGNDWCIAESGPVSARIKRLRLYLLMRAPSKFLFCSAPCVYLAEPVTGVPSCECACVCTHCARLAQSHCVRSHSSSCLPRSSLDAFGSRVGAGGRVGEPLLSLQVPNLQACDRRRWCHRGSASPTFYLCLPFLWAFGVVVWRRDWSQCPCGSILPQSACACRCVFACVDLCDLTTVSLCTPCIWVCWWGPGLVIP